jgi:hypothetical protein
MKQRACKAWFVVVAWFGVQVPAVIFNVLGAYDRHERLRAAVDASRISAPVERLPDFEIEHSAQITDVINSLLSSDPPVADFPPFGNSVRVANDVIVNRTWANATARHMPAPTSSAVLW